VRVKFGCRGKVGTDRQLVKMGAHNLKIVLVGDRVGGEAVLPDGEFGVEPVGESVPDKSEGMTT